MVDLVAMQIVDALDARKFFQFGDGTHADDFFQIVAHPKGDGRSPVSISGHVPVSCVGEPVAESAFSDVLWDPSKAIMSIERGCGKSETGRGEGNG